MRPRFVVSLLVFVLIYIIGTGSSHEVVTMDEEDYDEEDYGDDFEKEQEVNE